MTRPWSMLAVTALLIAVLLPFLDRPRFVHRYVAIFDISQSMGVEDVTPEGLVDNTADAGTTRSTSTSASGSTGKLTSRLDLAKGATSRLLRALPCGSDLGLGVFAGGRTTLLLRPLEVCEHYAGLLASIESVDGRMRYENASRIGKALHQGLRVAHQSGDEAAMLLLTDGHEAPPLRDGQAGLPRSENLGISGFLIGVGDTVPAPIPKFDLAGQPIGIWQAGDVIQRAGQTHGEERSRREDEHLALLASLSGLDYLPLDDTVEVIDRLLEAPTRHEVFAPVDFRWLPAGTALLCLCMSFVWPRRPPALSSPSRDGILGNGVRR